MVQTAQRLMEITHGGMERVGMVIIMVLTNQIMFIGPVHRGINTRMVRYFWHLQTFKKTLYYGYNNRKNIRREI
jgi:hypothetical protein